MLDSACDGVLKSASQCATNIAFERPLMDVIFNCPKCDQELAVDSSGAGSEIDCPSCGESIVIPSPDSASRPLMRAMPEAAGGGGPINAIASSAAAKVEMHLRVPVHKTTEVLIEKPLAPLEVAAKET